MTASPQALNRAHTPAPILSGYSLEMTIREGQALQSVAPALPPGTSVAIAFLPGEELESRIAVARHVRALGFEPKVHLPARRIRSAQQLDSLLGALAAEARLRQVLVIAGDTDTPVGPYADALSVIETGLLETHGIRQVSIGGHPEGHPAMTPVQCNDWLMRKVAAITARGMAPDIVTQFGFDADAMLHWLDALRALPITVPVALGVPGPTSARKLLAYAARCGVGASTSVLRKYGLSLTSLMTATGPDRMVNALESGLADGRHGPVSLHFYPFGGLENLTDWIAARQA
jgi:methylenetetrahydrofolate reductase (NADPH)